MNKELGFSLIGSMIAMILIIGSISAYLASTANFSYPVNRPSLLARKILVDSEIIKAAINSCENYNSGAIASVFDTLKHLPEGVESGQRNAQNVCSLSCPGDSKTIWEKLNVECPTYHASEGLDVGWTLIRSNNIEDCRQTPDSLGLKHLDGSMNTDSIQYISIQSSNSGGRRSSGVEAINLIIDLMTGVRYIKDIESSHQIRTQYALSSKTLITAEDAGIVNSCINISQSDPGGRRLMIRVH